MSPAKAAWTAYIALGGTTVTVFGFVKLWAADPWMGAAATPVVAMMALAAVQVARDQIRKRDDR